MGATRNTGYLENLIAYDASNNVAIATTAIDNAFKITMGGSVKMTGALSGTSATFTYADNAYGAGITVTNSTNNTAAQSKINIVNSAGNLLALIQNSPSVNSGVAYIGTSGAYALTIGTNYATNLTIASTGAATFSGSVGVTGFTTKTGNGLFFNFGASSANQASIQSYDWGASVFRSLLIDALDFNVSTNGSSRLTISSTGAATFSSSVTAGNAILNESTYLLKLGNSSSANNATLALFNNGAQNLEILYAASGKATFHNGINASANAFYIGRDNTYDLVINSSGNVGIGTTSISNPISFIRVLNISGGDAGLVFSNTNGTAKNWSIGAIDSGSFVFFDGASERMRIRSGGEVSFIPTTWTYVNPSTSYRNMDFGAGGWLYRDNSDVYLTSNNYYNTSGQWVAKYSYNQGMGILSLAGGNFTWSSHDGNVTAGTGYSLSPRFLITSSGNLLFNGTSNPGGIGNIYIGNSGSLPGTPSGGGVLYVEGGALKFKGSSGTITTIANA